MNTQAIEFNRLNTVDHLIRELTSAPDDQAKPIIAFPAPSNANPSDHYEYFQATDLDRMTEGAAAAYIGDEVQPTVRQTSILLLL